MAELQRPEVSEKPKKRIKLGRTIDLTKQEKLKSHVAGEACNCVRLRCYETTTPEFRTYILSHFNALKTKNEQDAFLSTMITVNKVRGRRTRQEDEGEAQFHDYSYKYHLNAVTETHVLRVEICFKALLSMFDVTKGRVERIRQSLALTGLPPKDKRGQHHNRPHAFSDDDTQQIIDHISSFHGRKSHYSRRKSKRLYLSDNLNITKMYQFFMEKYPETTCSYESYRHVFNSKFNISFGYPRKDTCSTCDRLQSQINHLATVITYAPSPEAATKAEGEKARILVEKELHLRKAEVFYERKANARRKAQDNVVTEAVCFDFQKNLPCPNVTTNDVYYSRQLSFYSLNIHVLSTNQVYLYCYDETIGKKGADDVSSMLMDFFENHLSADVRKLSLFCDSCAGQNKNWTVLRLMHHCVHTLKRFDKVSMTFLVRGHSFMECDKDMGHVNQKKPCETPSEWQEELRSCRVKPSPFQVINMTQEKFSAFSGFLQPRYLTSCPVPTRPIRELYFFTNHPQFMMYQESWNGPFSSAVVIPRPKAQRGKGRGNQQRPQLPEKPRLSYNRPLPISAPKFKDLQKLKDFCKHANAVYFQQLPHMGEPAPGENAESTSDSESISDESDDN